MKTLKTVLNSPTLKENSRTLTFAAGYLVWIIMWLNVVRLACIFLGVVLTFPMWILVIGWAWVGILSVEEVLKRVLPLDGTNEF